MAVVDVSEKVKINNTLIIMNSPTLLNMQESLDSYTKKIDNYVKGIDYFSNITKNIYDNNNLEDFVNNSILSSTISALNAEKNALNTKKNLLIEEINYLKNTSLMKYANVVNNLENAITVKNKILEDFGKTNGINALDPKTKDALEIINQNITDLELSRDALEKDVIKDNKDIANLIKKEAKEIEKLEAKKLKIELKQLKEEEKERLKDKRAEERKERWEAFKQKVEDAGGIFDYINQGLEKINIFQERDAQIVQNDKYLRKYKIPIDKNQLIIEVNYPLSNTKFNRKTDVPSYGSTYNSDLASLISSGPDAMSNMFNVYITFFNNSMNNPLEDTYALFNWTEIKSEEQELRKKLLDPEFLSFRIKNINIPGMIRDTYDIKVTGGDTITKPATYYGLERKGSLTIRMDQMLYLNNFFNLLSKTNYDFLNGLGVNLIGDTSLEDTQTSLKKIFQSTIPNNISLRANISSPASLISLTSGKHLNIIVRRSVCKFLYFKNPYDVTLIKGFNQKTHFDDKGIETNLNELSPTYKDIKLLSAKQIKNTIMDLDAWDTGDFNYTDSSVYPWAGAKTDKMNDFFIFYDVKFLGASNGIEFKRENPDPAELTYEFIYRDIYRMTGKGV